MRRLNVLTWPPFDALMLPHVDPCAPAPIHLTHP
jgi:hypothetical protein